MSRFVQERIELQAKLDKQKRQTMEEIKNGIRRANMFPIFTTGWEADIKHNEKETFAKFYGKFLSCYTREQLQYLEDVFLEADKDQDHELSPTELKIWFGNKGFPISNGELIGILEMGDSNKDGYLTFDEFVTLCLRMEVRNIPHEARNIAGKKIHPDFQYCICNVNHYMKNYRKPDKSGRLKSTNEQIEGCAKNLQRRRSVAKKFSDIVLPGLLKCGGVNIANVISYFETEISRQTSLKTLEMHARCMMGEAKKNYKRHAAIAAARQAGYGKFNYHPSTASCLMNPYDYPEILHKLTGPKAMEHAKVLYDYGPSPQIPPLPPIDDISFTGKQGYRSNTSKPAQVKTRHCY